MFAAPHKEARKWISVDTRLPKRDAIVFAHWENGQESIVCFKARHRWIDPKDGVLYAISPTHWRLAND